MQLAVGAPGRTGHVKSATTADTQLTDDEIATLSAEFDADQPLVALHAVDIFWWVVSKGRRKGLNDLLCMN